MSKREIRCHSFAKLLQLFEGYASKVFFAVLFIRSYFFHAFPWSAVKATRLVTVLRCFFINVVSVGNFGKFSCVVSCVSYANDCSRNEHL